jgi:lysozyme
MKGIDVSHWQNQIDWDSVKSEGIEFVILKAGGSDNGFYTDKTFETNYTEARNHGLHVGAYYFVGPKCTSRESGEADAKRFLEIIKGKQFDMPVYIDFEAPNASNVSGNTDACIGFCEVMKAAGYYPGIYASDVSGFKNRLDKSKLTAYTWWVARYGKEPEYAVERKDIWQYSSAGTVKGINANVDMNEAYTDFPSYIAANGLNGYEKRASAPAPSPARKSNEQIANEVIAGQWGVGDDRKNRITAAGYDYETIRAIVNQKLGVHPAPARKSNEQIANEVIAGKWGVGDDRKNRITAAGYDYNTIRNIVNAKLGVHPAPERKSNEQIANEVIAGKWGVGNDRKRRITAAGYNYETIRAIVNRKMGR